MRRGTTRPKNRSSSKPTAMAGLAEHTGRACEVRS